MSFLLIAVVWLVCGLIGSGFTFAYMQDNWPDLAEQDFQNDLGFSLCMIIFGPSTMVIGVFVSEFGKYGWRLWRRTGQKPDDGEYGNLT